MTAYALTAQDVAHRKATTLGDVVQKDLIEAFRAWPLWTMLAWDDIRQRYQRSTLGPIWITLSMALFIGMLSVIYGILFKLDIVAYLPYLAAGYILWGFISSNIVESCSAFQSSAGVIQQIRLPFGIYVLRTLWRNFIVFLHTAVIFVVVALVFGLKPGPIALLALPGFCLLYINLIWVGLTLAIISTRYRDVVLLVTTTVQIAIFITPIIWHVDRLGQWAVIAYLNPLFHLIDIVRGPLLGTTPMLLSWVVAAALAIAGWTIAILLLRRASPRIVFWL